MTIEQTSILPTHTLSIDEQNDICDKFSDNPELVGAEILAGKYPYDVKSDGNSTLLHYALMLGQFDVANYLVKKGIQNNVNLSGMNCFDCFFLKNEYTYKTPRNLDAFIHFMTEHQHLFKNTQLSWAIILLNQDEILEKNLVPPEKHYKLCLEAYQKLIDNNILNPNTDELLKQSKENCPEFLNLYCTHFNLSEKEFLLSCLKEKELVSELWITHNDNLSTEQIENNQNRQKEEEKYYQLALTLINQSITENLTSGEIRKKHNEIKKNRPKIEYYVDKNYDVLDFIIKALASKKEVNLFSFLKPALSQENISFLGEIQQLCNQYQFKSMMVDKHCLNEYYIRRLKRCLQTTVNYFNIEKDNLGLNELTWRCRNPLKNIPEIQGYYLDKTKTIEICSERSLDESTCVHEYTHFLQYKLEKEKIGPYLDELINVIKTTNNEMNVENWTHFIMDSIKHSIKTNAIEPLHSLVLNFLNQAHVNQEEKLQKQVDFELDVKKILKENLKETSKSKNIIATLLYDEIITMIKVINNKDKIENSIEIDLLKKIDTKRNILRNLPYNKQYWAKHIEIHARLNEQNLEKKIYPALNSNFFSEPVMKTITPSLEKFNQLLVENAKLFFSEKKEESKNKFKA